MSLLETFYYNDPGSGSHTDFVDEHTAEVRIPLLPELPLRLADVGNPFWTRPLDEIESTTLPCPYWAFAWSGGQALARYLLDNPALAEGARVVDFAAGCGLQGIAAARSGAQSVIAYEIDLYAVAAVDLNSAACSVEIESRYGDIVGRTDLDCDLLLAGDVFYDPDVSILVYRWLRTLAETGTRVLIGDPGRVGLPKTGLRRLARYYARSETRLQDPEGLRASVYELG